jgi:hypothetical protein
MATRQQQDTVLGSIGQHLLGSVNDALALAQRFREVDGFRRYVRRRLRLVIPALALLLVTGFACAMATVMLLLGPQPLLALLGLLLAPLVLAGSLFVQLYVFFAWLEERALARSLGHRTGPAPGRFAAWTEHKLGADLGRMPPVPWVLAAIFVLAPLAVLTQLAPKSAALLIVLLVLAPILYARLDR